MPSPLTTDHLSAIQRLISEPLRDAVRTEMEAGNERVAAAVSKLSEKFDAYAAEANRRERLRDERIHRLETRVARFERFRTRVLAVYGAVCVIVTATGSAIREWLVLAAHRK